MTEEFAGPVSPMSNESLQVTEHETVVREPRLVPQEEPRAIVQKPDTDSTVLPVSRAVLPSTSNPSTSGVRVQAPQGLRSLRAASERQQGIIQTVGETLRMVAQPPQEIRVEQKSSSELTENSSPSVPSEVTQFSGEDSEQARATQVIVHRESLTAKAPTPPVQVTTTRAEAMPEIKSEAPSKQLPPVLETKFSNKENVAPMQSQVVLRPQVEKQTAETRPVEVRAAASRQTPLPSVRSTADKRRQSQISIGRIDVQVNNQPQLQPASPQAKMPPHSSFLDARYLSRFFLRL
jgi:hypothetical protein